MRLGTRGSALALAQSRQVAVAIEAATGIRVELVPITSAGDVTRASLAEIGGTGVFATALRDALAAGECDLLVHSLKDLPTAPAPGLEIAAIPARADARDVLVTRRGATPAHLRGTVGTGSPRRIAQLRRAHPHLAVVDMRGNVDSRLGRVRSGELDAVVLAAAGLDRLQSAAPGSFDDSSRALDRHSLDLDGWPTAPGQGALAIEVRAGDSAVADAVAALDDLPTRIAVVAERTVLAELEAGCHAPVGASAVVAAGVLSVRATVYSLDGVTAISASATVPMGGDYAEVPGSGNGAEAARHEDPIARAGRAGTDVARRLLAEGAAALTERETPG